MPRHNRLEEVKRAAASSDPVVFVHEWLLSSDPFAFRSTVGGYARFRAELAHALGVHAAQLTLVGSGQLGFSLRPDRLLRSFRRDSDLDVVIVSSEVFDRAWEDLLILVGPNERFKLNKFSPKQLGSDAIDYPKQVINRPNHVEHEIEIS